MTAPARSGPGLPSATGAAGLSIAVWLYLAGVVLPVEFQLGSLALSLQRVFLLAVIVPLTVNLFTGRYGKIMATDYLFLAHILWASLAVAVNNPSRAVENIGSTATEFLGGYVVGRAFIRTPDQFEKLFKVLIFFVVAFLPFSIVEARTGNAIIPAFIDGLPGVDSVPQLAIDKRMGLERVQNVFAHPIHYGLFCSVAFAMVWVGFASRMASGARTFYLIAIAFSVFLSLSSGALLSLLLQAGLIGWAYVFRNVKRKWAMFFGLLAFLYVAIDLLSNRTPIRVLMSYATFSAHTAFYRGIIFEWGMKNVWANPILGLGLRSWIRPGYMTTGSVDNFWLVMAMRNGIPGFLLIIGGYFAGLIRIGRRDLSAAPVVEKFRLAWMITFCGLSFTLCTVHIWTAIYSFVFFMFGSAMWLATYSPAEEAATPEPATGRDRRLTYSRGSDRVAPGGVEEQAPSPPPSPYTRFGRGR